MRVIKKIMRFGIVLPLLLETGCGFLPFSVRDRSSVTEAQSQAEEARALVGVGVKDSNQAYQQVVDALKSGLEAHYTKYLANVSASTRYGIKEIYASIKSSLGSNNVDIPTADGLMAFVRLTSAACYFNVLGEATVASNHSTRVIYKDVDISAPTNESVAVVVQRLSQIFWRGESIDDEASILSSVTALPQSADNKYEFWASICTTFATTPVF